MAHLHADLGHAAARAGAAEHAQDTGQLDRGLGRVLGQCERLREMVSRDRVPIGQIALEIHEEHGAARTMMS